MVRENQMPHSSQRGSVMLEFALTIGVVAFLIGASLDALRLFYTFMMCEYAATSALRTANISGEGAAQARGTAIERAILSSLRSYGIELPREEDDPLSLLNSPYVTVCPPSGTVNSCTAGDIDDAGGDQETVEIRVDLPVKVLFHSLPLTLHLSVFGKNEPFGAD